MGDLTSLEGRTPSPVNCPSCGGLEGLSETTITVTLSEINTTASRGCRSCKVIQNYHLRGKGREIQPSECDDSDVRFQIPVLDRGFPMNIGTSIDDDDFFWGELYTVSGSPLSPWPLIGHATERKRHAIEAIPVLKAWIDDCLLSHPGCENEGRALPTRVLDVGNNQVSLFISGGHQKPYAALSHCWGKVAIVQTTVATLEQRVEGISWDSLSPTFRDAVTTTRLLGLQYLWIDSLCILQDDLLDWTRESGAMASIYEGAQIVIAASDAEDGSHGFLHPRDESLPTTVTEDQDHSGFTIRSRPWDRHMWCHDLLSPLIWGSRQNLCPLSTRGWAFQERLLATRYVQFRSHELVWECRSCLKCECSTLSRPSQTRTKMAKAAFQLALNSPDISKILDIWQKVVDSYAVRQLTNKEDLLPALSGLAKQLRSSSPGLYLAGHWLETMPLSLLWEAQGVRASPYRAPTWSWASIDTSKVDSSLISTWEAPGQISEIHATVITAYCLPKGDDATGRVAGGHITISGKLLEVIAPKHRNVGDSGSAYDWDLVRATPPRPSTYRGPAQDSAKEFTFGFHADFLFTERRQTLFCLLIAEIPSNKAPRALVLRQIPNSIAVYERVGLIDRCILGSSIRSYNWMFLFDNAPTKIITIV